MQISKIVFFAFALCVSGCSGILPPGESSNDVTLSVDKTGYALSDTIIVTLQNNGDEPLFLGGCNPILIASKTDTGWNATTLVECVWEGFAQKVESGISVQQKIPAAYYPGTHKFFAMVYTDCAENQPLGNDCRLLGGIYSEEFNVGERGNAVGNLEITTERQQYSWQTSDLGSSRLVRATLMNKSSQTFYAILGDAMVGSIDQEDLHVANGSHGYLEQRQTTASWRELPRGILIEGVRYIALRPGQSHRLLMHLYSLQGNETGAFRLRVDYFDRIDPPVDATPRMDYSNVFTIAH